MTDESIHKDDLLVKLIGDRRFPHDLNQIGIEFSAAYTFLSIDADMHSKVIKLVRKVVNKYNKVRSETDTKETKKEATQRK